MATTVRTAVSLSRQHIHTQTHSFTHYINLQMNGKALIKLDDDSISKCRSFYTGCVRSVLLGDN